MKQADIDRLRLRLEIRPVLAKVALMLLANTGRVVEYSALKRVTAHPIPQVLRLRSALRDWDAPGRIQNLSRRGYAMDQDLANWLTDLLKD